MTTVYFLILILAHAETALFYYRTLPQNDLYIPPGARLFNHKSTGMLKKSHLQASSWAFYTKFFTQNDIIRPQSCTNAVKSTLFSPIS